MGGAVFLRFATAVWPNGGSAPPRPSASGLFRLGGTPGSLPNDSSDDAYAPVPQPINNAISAAYELGITGGYPDHTFRPNDPVPRLNMPTFIMNALNPTNLRPAGLGLEPRPHRQGGPRYRTRRTARASLRFSPSCEP